jgi:hypothetical protein
MKDTKQISDLLDFICFECGLCGCLKGDKPLHVLDIIPSEGPVNADNFVEWALLGDDVNPNDDYAISQQIKPKIREAFIRIMGAETVDASMLHF